MSLNVQVDNNPNCKTWVFSNESNNGFTDSLIQVALSYCPEELKPQAQGVVRILTEEAEVVDSNVLVSAVLYIDQIEDADSLSADAKCVKLAEALYKIRYSPSSCSDAYFREIEKLVFALRGTNAYLEDALNYFINDRFRRMPHFVGELGSRWEFPSDHLPIGAKVDNFSLVSWNVLNTHFIQSLEGNAQGLKNSLILKENKEKDEEERAPRKGPMFHLNWDLDRFTMRDQCVLDKVRSMISDGKSLIALQECGRAFIKALKESLPPQMDIILSRDIGFPNQEVLLYDRERFELLEKNFTQFSYEKRRVIGEILLSEKSTGKKYQIFMAHIPGGFRSPGMEEFAKYVLDHRKEGSTSILLGDFNCEIDKVWQAFGDQAHTFYSKANYPTHIGYNRKATVIDHILVEDARAEVQFLGPEEVMSDLMKMTDFLK